MKGVEALPHPDELHAHLLDLTKSRGVRVQVLVWEQPVVSQQEEVLKTCNDPQVRCSHFRARQKQPNGMWHREWTVSSVAKASAHPNFSTQKRDDIDLDTQRDPLIPGCKNLREHV